MRFLRCACLALCCGGLLSSCSSSEGPAVAAAVELTPGVLSLDLGDTMRVTAVVKDGNGKTLPNAVVTYSVDNQVVATVSTTGLVTTHLGGTATLTATSGGASKGAPITVAGPAASIQVIPSIVDLPFGGTRQLGAIVRDAQSRVMNHPTVSFVSKDQTVATVSSAGLLAAVAVGFDSLTVTSGSAVQYVSVAVVTHPAGSAAGTPAVASRPFAVAVSRTGVALTGRQDLPYLQLSLLPDTGFRDSVKVGADPTDIAFTSAGTTAYVTNQFSLNVGVINVTTKQSVDSIPVPSGNPFRILVAPDDQHVYVSTSTGMVFEIATATKAITRQWVLSPSPVNGMAFHPNGDILYATSTGGSIFEVTTSTGTVRLDTPGGTLQDIAVSLDGTEVYIANEGGDLDVRDAATGGRLTTIPAAANAFGLKLSPDGTQLYASVIGSGQVKVIDRSSRAVTQTLTVGGTPRRIAFNRLGTTALIPNESGWVNVVR